MRARDSERTALGDERMPDGLTGESRMKISVILCTYNRSASLGKALESVTASILPSLVDWEVLVVDNNSKDQTREVVKSFCDRYPHRFRYLFEPQQGKSNALNRGIREAHGSVLAFTDDDVIVEPTWLQNLTSKLNGGEWSGAGGRVRPARSFVAPRWLPLAGPNNMGGVLAIFDLGEDPRQLNQPPIGNNMAFRREMFEKYGCFRSDLGPRPCNEIRDEDTEFGRRLLAAGERLRYEPSAVIYHDVPEKRIKKEYFLKFWFDTGRTMIRTTERRPDILGIPRLHLSLLKHATVLFPSYTIQWLLNFSAGNRFYRKCWVWLVAGEILELYRRVFASGQEQDPSSSIETVRGA